MAPSISRPPSQHPCGGFSDKSAQLPRLAGMGCLGEGAGRTRGRWNKEVKMEVVGGVGAADVVICGLSNPQLAGEIFPKHLQQITDHDETGIRSLLWNQQPQLGWFTSLLYIM